MRRSPKVFSSSFSLAQSYLEIFKFVHLNLQRSNWQQHAQPRKYCFHTSTYVASQQRENPSNHWIAVLDSYKRTLHLPVATHEIQDLSNIGDSPGGEVILHGYLGARADLSKNLFFIPLISKTLDYTVQIVSSAKSSDGSQKPAHVKLRALEQHSPVAIRGLLKARNPTAQQSLGQIKKIDHVEIDLLDVDCLNEFPKDIIFTEDTKFPPNLRHLQIRSDKSIRDAVAFRAQVASVCRDELSKRNGFIEIETPILFKSTPEGAREFLVPTRRKGLAYALPQSPQQYKQILMASGIPRYYQLAKCFRDEDLRADRQPEFTQLDFEVSFASGDEVMAIVEALVRRLWAVFLNMDDLATRFPQMSYHDAMSKYGSDKPDIRIGMEIADVGYLLPADLVSKISPLRDPVVEVLKFHVSDEVDETRRFVRTFMDSSDSASFQENPEGGPGIFVVDSRKPLQGLQPFGFEAAEQLEELLALEDGDLVVLQARKRAAHTGGATPLGNLRLALSNAAVRRGYAPKPEGYEFLWITDFPLFSPTIESEPGQGGIAGLSSTHHPFTSPKPEDVDLLLTEPTKVRGDHYDLVLNGVELGGGSRRIHDARVQEFIMKDILLMSEMRMKEFSHLFEVLRAGCPPHAGIALGFDRLIAVMLGKDSVRDVIAFPKSGKGEDPMVSSPGPLTNARMQTYHLSMAGGL
ncbi:MAG: hypothetical protein M1836_000846 [Candelina mexicana]|nr:MAG: hypothetical protein M1836_000846 [Candelina mexicana]